MRKILLAPAAALLPLVASAHPGHHPLLADTPARLLHLLSAPDHLAALLLAGVLLYPLWRRRRQRRASTRVRDCGRGHDA